MNQFQDSDDLNLVTVFSTADSSMASLAASCLEAEEIPCMIRNQDMQNMLGLGTIGGFNALLGPIELLVPDNYVAQATTILKSWQLPDSPRRADRPKTLIETIAKFFFILMLFVNVTTAVYVPSLLLIIIPITGFLLLCIPSYMYLQHMHRIGYEWPMLGDAIAILWSCRGRAYDLPPAAEVETVPGFRRDSESIIEFLNKLKVYKRDAARQRKQND